jgi:hypothetical protein
MKALAIVSESLGLISSILLVWGYRTPAGVINWVNDLTKAKRSESTLDIVAKTGFALLAVSFALKIYMILIS